MIRVITVIPLLLNCFLFQLYTKNLNLSLTQTHKLRFAILKSPKTAKENICRQTLIKKNFPSCIMKVSWLNSQRNWFDPCSLEESYTYRARRYWNIELNCQFRYLFFKPIKLNFSQKFLR